MLGEFLLFFQLVDLVLVEREFVLQMNVSDHVIALNDVTSKLQLVIPDSGDSEWELM